MKKSQHAARYLLILLLGIFISFTTCKKEEIDKSLFVGEYTVVEKCGIDTETYTATISDATFSPDGVAIGAFPFGFSSSAFASVKGDKITIPRQHNDNAAFSGEGTVSGNILTINFTVVDGADLVDCVATFTKN